MFLKYQKLLNIDKLLMNSFVITMFIIALDFLFIIDYDLISNIKTENKNIVQIDLKDFDEKFKDIDD